MDTLSQLRRQTAAFLRDCRRRDPDRFRAIARRYPVLSTWQVDRRKEREAPLEPWDLWVEVPSPVDCRIAADYESSSWS